MRKNSSTWIVEKRIIFFSVSLLFLFTSFCLSVEVAFNEVGKFPNPGMRYSPSSTMGIGDKKPPPFNVMDHSPPFGSKKGSSGSSQKYSHDPKPYVSEDGEPFSLAEREENEKKWNARRNKWKLPPLHEEKYDWYVVKGVKTAWSGFKKGVGWVFRAIGKILAPLFKTVIDNPKEDAQVVPKEVSSKVLRKVNGAWNQKESPDIPSEFSFIQKGKFQQNYEIGNKYKSGGLSAVKEMKNYFQVDTEYSLEMELRLRDSFLKAQENLFIASETISESRGKLDEIVRHVNQLFKNKEEMINFMNDIVEEYLGNILRAKETRVKLNEDGSSELLKDYAPGVLDISIGPLLLLAKDSGLKRRLMESRISAGHEVQVLQNLEEPAKILRKIYGKPAEDVVHWQKVIMDYGNKLKLGHDNENKPIEQLHKELDGIALRSPKPDIDV